MQPSSCKKTCSSMAGDDEKKIRKAAQQLDADSVCLDCEDGVAVTRKSAARDVIPRMLGELNFGRSERAVRINPFGELAWTA